MERIVVLLGGRRAVSIRIAFLILALVVTCLPLVHAKPERKAEPTTAPPVTTTEVTTKETTTEETEPEIIKVVVPLESVEKDIRIGFYDEEWHVITGFEFEVEIEDAKGNKATYSDKDMDGYIIITDVVPGLAKVTPVENERYEFLNAPYSLTVKDKVEYKPIKNVVVKNDGADVKKETKSPVIKDTVELVESRVEEIVTYKTLAEAGLTVTDPYPKQEETTKQPETTTAAPETTTQAGGEDQETTTEPETTTAPPETTTVAPVDDNAKLFDSTGKYQLYVKVGDKYREAVNKDYSPDAVFYIAETEYKYYGWQNIDGKVYYFDKNGEYVTGTQVIGGVKYTFSQTGARGGTLGVDVSIYQGNIDWQKAKKAGIDFAIIRLGYRGWGSNGSLNIDGNFHRNLAGARAAGIKVGVYFFSQAKTEVEAVEEASLCIKELGGQGLNLPIFIDTETAAGGQGRADNLTVKERTDVCVAFCNTIQNAGYRAGVYSNKYFYTSKLDTPRLLGFTIWLAEWPSEVNADTRPTYSGRYDFWQFSERGDGKTFGMGSQYVDMNYS
ncbi:MAG: hypothetical protein J5782_03610 [Clostridia bacterium]|nr:hypothetical protein [Clostridia bacterium]